MFFPKLRRQAKWMFVFLALAFGIGFVAFGIGGTGGSGISDLFQRSASSSSGPSVDDAQEKIDDGNLAAYKELTEAYRADGRQDEAIAAGEKYVKARPKDYDFMRTLASDYEAKAARLRQQAAAVQADLVATTGGTTFSLPQDSVLGRALGTGRIDQELTTAANQKLTEQYSRHPDVVHARDPAVPAGRRRPTRRRAPPAPARAVRHIRHSCVPTALKAYERVIKLAPDSAEAQQAKQQMQLLKLQAQAGRVPSG